MARIRICRPAKEEFFTNSGLDSYLVEGNVAFLPQAAMSIVQVHVDQIYD
ncbi:MAG: hypothetical protein ACYS67_05885 [Planctomycetota bacterium]